MSIQEMQDEIKKVGWQWIEHVFNDSGPECYVQLNPTKNPHVFGNYSQSEKTQEDQKKTVGWGRFERHYAWMMAYDYIVRGLRS